MDRGEIGVHCRGATVVKPHTPTAYVIVSDLQIWHYLRQKNQVLYQTKLELYLPEMILNLVMLILYLSRWMFHLLNLFNINITDFASDFYI